jgi:teichuronic acid biosynthesis glycosyltransferase TuaG
MFRIPCLSRKNITINNMPTRISVIIPNWNGAKTIEAVIRSCINQTLKPIEILVCDDGSTDDSEKIVKEINNNLVQWIPLPHSGTPAIPRNNGINMSKGEWIAFCDNDDEWVSTKLEKQISLLIKLGCEASCTNAIRRINGVNVNKKMINYKKEKISFCDLLNSNSIVCSSSLVKKSILEKVDKFSEKIEHGSYADFICWLRVLTQTNFAFINESLIVYDDHPQTSIRASETSAEKLKSIALDNFIVWSKKMNLPYFRYLTKKHIVINNLLKLIKKVIHV